VRTLDTMRTALDTASEQFSHDIADQLFLERIKSQMDGIHGHQEALELQGTILMYTAQELGVIKCRSSTGQRLSLFADQGALDCGRIVNHGWLDGREEVVRLLDSEYRDTL
jgi:hypothetical protein